MVRPDSAAHGFRGEWRYGLLNDVRELDRAPRPDGQAVRRARLGRETPPARQCRAASSPRLEVDRAISSGSCASTGSRRRAGSRADAGRGVRPGEALARRTLRAPRPRALASAGRSRRARLGEGTCASATKSARPPRARACAISAARRRWRTSWIFSRPPRSPSATTRACCTSRPRPARTWSRSTARRRRSSRRRSRRGGDRRLSPRSNAARVSRASARSKHLQLLARIERATVLAPSRALRAERAPGAAADEPLLTRMLVSRAAARHALRPALAAERAGRGLVRPRRVAARRRRALETSGRGAVLIVADGAETWVLRHYRRGGFVARFIDDHYSGRRRSWSRAFREWRLLRRLHDAGLPVPNPIAAHVYRHRIHLHGGHHHGVLARHAQAVRVHRRGTVPADCWRQVGRMVRAVHRMASIIPISPRTTSCSIRAASCSSSISTTRNVKPPATWNRRRERALPALVAQGRARDRHRVRSRRRGPKSRPATAAARTPASASGRPFSGDR